MGKRTILLVNIVIALAYNGCSNSGLINSPDASIGFVFGLPFLIIVHMVILAAIGMFLEKNKKAKRYFHSIIWVLIIGLIGFLPFLLFPSLYWYNL